jgi:hypothetical protein
MEKKKKKKKKKDKGGTKLDRHIKKLRELSHSPPEMALR